MLALPILADPGSADAAANDPTADVHAIGVPHHGDTRDLDPAAPLIGIAPTPSGDGYWVGAADGGVFNFGSAAFLGSLGDIELVQPIVGIAAHPSEEGFWMVASDGGVFAFGDVGFYGSLGDLVLDEPIVGMAVHPNGLGYWLVASDGGVFAFGSASFNGSMGGIPLKEPVVGMAAHPGGGGYWLVASDGGIFTFGDASFLGSTGAITLDQPIVAMAARAGGDGYWLGAADGGVFTFGEAEFVGSAAGTDRLEPVVGMAPSGDGAGYWLVRAASPSWPLTGLPTPDVDQRPALSIKIDNHPAARGQWGLAQADIVFEELVEGGVTRFVAVFHSHVPTRVGPIRSARESDLEILPMFGRSLLVFSGGNATVRGIVGASDLIEGIYPNSEYWRAYYRTSARSIPHNLLARPSRLWEFATSDMGAPPTVFEFRSARPLGALPPAAPRFVIDFGSRTVAWTWDGQKYLRSNGFVVHRDADLRRVTATNIVVLESEYHVSAATGSPVVRGTGSGIGVALVDGREVDIEWVRTTLTNPYVLTETDSGDVLQLTPGTTWIELVPEGLAPFG